MIDDRHDELAALAALDLLDGAEKASFEAEMAADPELARRVDELRIVAADLAHAAPPVAPPARLRELVLASAASASRSAARSSAARRLFFPTLLPWSIAAALAVAVVWALALGRSVRLQNDILRDQERLAVLDQRSLHNRLEQQELIDSRELTTLADRLKAESDPARMRVDVLPAPSGDAASALAVVVWNLETQKGFLSVAKLPPKAADRDYQLWIIPDAPKAAPISAGVLPEGAVEGRQRMAFSAPKAVPAVAKFAVSLERKGGASAPAGPIVALSE